ncbi:50S ribosomal protein L15 [Patescibacteria group bacterium]|nr:MAG: 50S ribosomal protein L15 [Patescibacteria group bacterium]
MQFHTLRRVHKGKHSVQVGRGGKRGKTSGRGTKGQSARAGRKKRPEFRDIIKRLPKLRGRGKNVLTSIGEKLSPVNLSVIDRIFGAGETVSPKTLALKSVVRLCGGRPPRVKILGEGRLTKPLIISSCLVSAAARLKIEKAGGTINQ